MNGPARAPLSWADRELRLCLAANRATRWAAVARFFSVVSRLGDGPFWYGLIMAMPLALGGRALGASLQMAFTGLCALALYYSLKGFFRRPRPYRRHDRIRLCVPPLDEFSFPSGHTLQAVSFTVVAVAWYPALIWLLGPFTLLVGASRVVLGLHYPSDVLAATIIGLALGWSSLTIFPTHIL